MSWHPSELVSDLDLIAYEATLIRTFGRTTWQDRRSKALEDWLFPILRARGFAPHRLRTRYEADAVFGYTASTYTDLTDAAKDTTEGDLALATVFATPGTDALYVGSTQPFRGLHVSILDAPSAVPSILTVAYWAGAWQDTPLSDSTERTRGTTLSGGGPVTWVLPTEWLPRRLNGSDALYWAKVTVSAVPTATTAAQVGVVRALSLRAPVTLRTLELIFREAPTGADGPWLEKATFYADQAERALERALLICGGEFDTDASDLISPTEAAQTVDQVSTGFSWERA